MGNIDTQSGMSRALYEAAYAWIGQIRGGLASATVVGCAGFAALSGSSIATALTIGSVSLKEMARFNFNKGDSEGLVNIPLQMKGIYFSAFLREDTEKDLIRVSLRSQGTFPCNKFAAHYFNGGGHLNASGGQHDGTLQEAVAIFENALQEFPKL